jgi:DNA replication and repair protein RecF
MHLKSLKGSGFRNLQTFGLEFSPDKNLIHGTNGSGKTNLLEAIYYLCIGRSMRSSAEDEHLIRFNDELFRLEGSMQTQGGELTVESAFNKIEKRCKINGELQQKLSELIGRLPVVSLSPEDDQLCKDGPGVRRRYMDLAISQLSRTYLADLQEYRRVLHQRNRLLFDIREGRGQAASMDAWNQQLAGCGTRIIEKRIQVIDDLKEIAGGKYVRIAGGRERLGLRYHLSFKMEPGENTQQAFLKALSSSFEFEKRRGLTMFGPHRDDLEISIGGTRIRNFGSQGQQRTAAIALKLAEAELLAQQLGEKPILLLDEIFAELDRERGGLLVDQLEPGYQSFIATAKEEDVMDKKGFKTFKVEAGRISALD